MLTELSFGLDLESCAATGVENGSDLCVAEILDGGSPQAGEPWQERMLPLPAYIDSDYEGVGQRPRISMTASG